VIPVYNEIDGLAELHRRLVELLERLDGPAEVILVDDGGTDGSYEAMVVLHEADSRFCVLGLSRNFGHQVAVTAGLDFARGEAIIILDADLQDPPELVPELIARWREGYEVVYAVRRRREGESAFKRWTAGLFYRLLRRLAKLDIPAEAGDFRLVDRRAADAVRAMPEHARFLRGMFAWVGFRQIGVPFDRPARQAGQTKYPLWKMLRLAADGIFSFSATPLRMVLYLGLLVAGLSFLYGLVAIITRIGPFHTEPGWASLIVVVTFLGGVQLIALGVIGQYLARVFNEVRRRPLYLLRRVHGFSQGPPSQAPSASPAARQGENTTHDNTHRGGTSMK
jgi:dolichol-phosphate mannosyltransferase